MLTEKRANLVYELQPEVPRRKGEVLVHEMCAPAAGLRSSIEVDLSKLSEPVNYHRLLAGSLELWTQTLGLVDNLLALARVDSGSGSSPCEPIRLEPFLRDIWAPLAEQARSRNLRVTWHIRKDVIVNSDPQKLQLIVHNLFQSAINSADQGREIRVTDGSQDGYLNISIAHLQADPLLEQVHDGFPFSEEASTESGTSGPRLSLPEKWSPLVWKWATSIRSAVLHRATAWVLLFALVLGLGWSTVYRSGPHTLNGEQWGSKYHRTDFTVYQAAGQAVLDGPNIYRAHNRRDWYFMYLPIFAMAMVPFALLDPFYGSLLWYLLSVSMLAHALNVSIRLARRTFPRSRLQNRWLYLLTLLLVLWPVTSAIARGQASILVTYLVILAVLFHLQRRHWLAGCCLAGSIVIKAFPVMLLVYFLAKGRFKLVKTTAAFLALFVLILPAAVFGVKGNTTLLRQWLTTVALPTATPEFFREDIRYPQLIDPRVAKNQSIQAVTIRHLAGATAESAVARRETVARHVALVINLFFLMAAGWLCLRRRSDKDARDSVSECSLVILLMLLLSPVSWVQNYILLTLPLAVALAAAADKSGESTSLVFRVALLSYFATNILSLIVPSLFALGAFLVGAMAIWTSFAWKLAPWSPITNLRSLPSVVSRSSY